MRRFFDKTKLNPETGCLEWMAGRSGSGYGWFKLNGSAMKAHRARWVIEHGIIPAGLHVLHRCDNPACVNLEHLFLGTHGDNMADMVAKGRQARLCGETNGSRLHPERRPRGDAHTSRLGRQRLARGEANGNSKLSNAVIREVRLALALGEIQGVVASRYGVDRTTIGRIARNKAWRNIE